MQYCCATVYIFKHDAESLYRVPAKVKLKKIVVALSKSIFT